MKLKKSRKSNRERDVAPRVGAWIETIRKGKVSKAN